VSLLDLVLLLAAASFAVSGYRQGFVVGVLSFAGFLGGGVLAMLVAPTLVSRMQPGFAQSLVAIAIVLGLATAGQVVATFVGGLLRDRITWRPARLVDAGLGAAISVVAVLTVSWFLASALRQGPSPTLSREIRDSAVINAVDGVMPDQARNLFASFRRVLDDNGFPQVFGGLSAERIRPVDPPDPALADDPEVRAAAKSIVKIVGNASSCGKQVEGSGFVYAPHHVMTNAHVVAGVRSPRVQVGGVGRRHDATVVLYDSRRDLAVLYVPDLDAPALSFAGKASRGAGGVAAGFPLNGPYRLEAARVREEISARGPDIYRSSTVTRDVYSLYATVEPGNSGGPFVSPAGTVYGVIFAKSVDDPRTGYALTAAEVASDARAGASATSRVGSGSCT
jgi:S1-C subfamily serine protease